jgi:hypothetical protein
MMIRTTISGLLAAALAASTAYAGGLDAAGTEDDDLAPIVAPVGSAATLGGISTGALVAGGVAAVALGAILLNQDDDDDDDDDGGSTPGT